MCECACIDITIRAGGGGIAASALFVHSRHALHFLINTMCISIRAIPMISSGGLDWTVVVHVCREHGTNITDVDAPPLVGM